MLKFTADYSKIMLFGSKNTKELEMCKCNFFYKSLISKKTQFPTACSKWESIYTHDELDWSTIHLLPYTVARETFLQSFHFKVIHRYLACQSNLYKWKKAPSPSCLCCGIVDSIEHHLFLCVRLQHFWDELFTWLASIFSVRIDFGVTDIIFGLKNENEDITIHVFNYCILYAKYYIYSSKVNEKRVCLSDYKSGIKIRLEIEKYIATSQNKLKDYNSTWNLILMNLSKVP